MAIKVAINGFGRIGRLVLRALAESGRTDLKVVAINDLGSVATNAHLLKYDSVHGTFPHAVTHTADSLDYGAGPILVTAERDPAKLPWASHHAAAVDDKRRAEAVRIFQCQSLAGQLRRAVKRHGGGGGERLADTRGGRAGRHRPRSVENESRPPPI